MSKQRLEAFSDGVIAIIITIMVLELRVPHGHDWRALDDIWLKLLIYALSFVFLGTYWNTHHHLFHLATTVNGKVLWANSHLLFWLSLLPVTTAWMGEDGLHPLPTAAYGAVNVMCSLAWVILETTVVACQGPDVRLAEALGRDLKGKLSLAAYLVAIPLAFVEPWIAVAIYFAVALIWFVPDRRLESRSTRRNDQAGE